MMEEDLCRDMLNMENLRLYVMVESMILHLLQLLRNHLL